MEAYAGPLFDVQTHAIMPKSYDQVAGAIKGHPGLTDATKDIIANSICKEMADNLAGTARKTALGSHNVHVVTVNTFFPPLPGSQLITICEHINDWMAEATAGNPQLIGTASVPSPPVLAQAGPEFVKQGVDSIRAAVFERGLQGFLLASNYDGVFLGDPSFEPYFELAAQLHVPVIIHPAVHPVEERCINYKNIGGLSGFLNDQRTTLLDLAMAGILEKYPDLVIIATHLGGGILTSLGRFAVCSAQFPEELWYVDRDGSRRLLPQPIETYLRKIYYDCNNASVEDIAHAAAKVGPDHLLSGTDFPWTGDAYTRRILGGLSDGELKEKIAYGNASKLFSTLRPAKTHE